MARSYQQVGDNGAAHAAGVVGHAPHPTAVSFSMTAALPYTTVWESNWLSSGSGFRLHVFPPLARRNGPEADFSESPLRTVRANGPRSALLLLRA